MNHLTCQKTHILAWLNADNTLSFKLNGVKYLGFPKLDKRGEKYWKVDLTEKDKSAVSVNSSLAKKELTLFESYQAKVKAGKKMKDFAKEEVDAYAKWLEEQEKVKKAQVKETQLKEQIQSSSQSVMKELKERMESQHEPLKPN